ncbi:hypothetical protein LeptoLang_16305 [Leptospira interrogans serovar Icterohaemorrhagiae]|nr:hypothetical protein LeptoLang_16305 [Leptospira interrogans serovar Icterohaemorrhagiae]
MYRYPTREYQSDQSSRMLFSNELNYWMIKKIYLRLWLGRHIRAGLKIVQCGNYYANLTTL